jgi:hypothetical protein
MFFFCFPNVVILRKISFFVTKVDLSKEISLIFCTRSLKFNFLICKGIRERHYFCNLDVCNLHFEYRYPLLFAVLEFAVLNICKLKNHWKQIILSQNICVFIILNLYFIFGFRILLLSESNYIE